MGVSLRVGALYSSRACQVGLTYPAHVVYELLVSSEEKVLQLVLVGFETRTKEKLGWIGEIRSFIRNII